MVLLSVTEAQGIATVGDLLTILVALWDAVVHAGDPGNDLRLLAAMPAWTIPEIAKRKSWAAEKEELLTFREQKIQA